MHTERLMGWNSRRVVGVVIFDVFGSVAALVLVRLVSTMGS